MKTRQKVSSCKDICCKDRDSFTILKNYQPQTNYVCQSKSLVPAYQEQAQTRLKHAWSN